MKQRTVYMDYAAATPVHPKVMQAMTPYFSKNYGNPSSVYGIGRQARQAIDEARTTVANILNCNSGEIIFTSGGAESNNVALKGVAFALKQSGNHIITSATEHHVVINTCHFLEHFGFDVTYLPVDRFGLVKIDDLERAITDRTVLASIMLANNEVGTTAPVADFAKVVKDGGRARGRNIVFHTDAVQGAGALDVDVSKLGVDLLSLSSHKFYGPKGLGILYLREGTPFMPQQSGGSQEGNRRGGTENVPGIVGTGVALKLAEERRESNNKHSSRIRDRLIQGIKATITGAYLNGHPTQRLPNSVSFSFANVDGESLVHDLDLAGIAASKGSACASSSHHPSHVLHALEVAPEIARGTLRLTVGPENTDADVDYVLSVLASTVENLRAKPHQESLQ
jgi:cysteine desulfurase